MTNSEKGRPDNEIDEHRRSLVARQASLSDSYWKMVLVISGGAMIASFSFLTDLEGEPEQKCWLAAGWISLIFSLFASMYSQWLGAWAHRQAITQVDAENFSAFEKPGGKL